MNFPFKISATIFSFASNTVNALAALEQVGATCPVSTQCLEGLICEGSKCIIGARTLQNSGESCSFSTKCEEGLICEGSKCITGSTTVRSLNVACINISQCVQGLTCNNSKCSVSDSTNTTPTVSNTTVAGKTCSGSNCTHTNSPTPPGLAYSLAGACSNSVTGAVTMLIACSFAIVL